MGSGSSGYISRKRTCSGGRFKCSLMTLRSMGASQTAKRPDSTEVRQMSRTKEEHITVEPSAAFPPRRGAGRRRCMISDRRNLENDMVKPILNLEEVAFDDVE